jgi:S1-C subfamily serine protease
MKRNPLIGVLAVLLSLTGYAQTVPEPKFPNGFVGSPEFNTTAGRQSAGTAFLGRSNTGSQVFMLTVRHLLGPDGGFKELTPPEKVPAFVKSVRLKSFVGGGVKEYSVQGVSVPPEPDAKAPLFDLAAFKTAGTFKSDAVEIAEEKPAIGEPVWVIAQVRGGVNKGQFVHPAKVTENGDRWLVCEFDNPNIVTNGASGAPVLNAAGKAVGIYSGHGKNNGKVQAFAIPSPMILQAIQAQPLTTK